MYSYPITGLDRSLQLHEIQATTIYRKSAHEGGKVASPMH